jgi:transcriptional regulator with XRE-family HTH domain
MKNSINRKWDSLLGNMPQEDLVTFKADVLAMQFLGLIDLKMEQDKISKKELAQKVGTSASFITQLFRGDRKPNWNILAKISMELGLEFKVMTEEMIQHRIDEALKAYHLDLAKKEESERKGLIAAEGVEGYNS